MKYKQYFLYFLFLNGAKTAPSHVQATLDSRGAPLESQIHQQAANQPLTQKTNNNCHGQIFKEFTSTV